MANYRTTISRLQELKRQYPTLVGNELVNFAQDNIRAGSWEGSAWPARKPGAPRNEGRGLLINTGRGWRSIRISRRSATIVELTADTHMAAHNAGAHIKGNFGVREHNRTRMGRVHRVSAHSRNVDFKLPKRQFVGKSRKFDVRITGILVRRILNALK